MTGPACPDVSQLQCLLDEDRAGVEPEELVRHLETCAGCQQTLQTLAADPSDWEDTARGLTDEVRDEPALRQVVEDLTGQETPREPDTSFLRPTDRPGLLGLLGPYEVQEEIGRGGMGVVLKALDPRLNRVVAIKVMSPYLASSTIARRRFVREGRAAAAVCHENVVTVHGVDEAEGLPYLVMQYVAGESLQGRLDRGGPLEVAEIVRIGLQTAAGLAAAHAQGLIHRDIKPANLLLENGVARVKITDFGLARMTDDAQLSQNGTVTGTPEYMSPEQARGETVDHRADLFSLGSVLYAMCTGVPPFRGSSAVAVLRRVSDQQPAPVRSLNPDVPAWLDALVARLMAKAPANRFQSAAEVAALLESYLAHLRQPATVAAPALPPPKTPRRRSPFSFSRGVCLCLALALLELGLAVRLASGAPGAAAQPQDVQEYYRSFKDDQDITQDFALDGLDPAECVRPEKAGLLISLPAGHQGKRMGTGLYTTFPVKGDFEITMGFEVLKEPPPPDAGHGTGGYLWIDLDTPARNQAMLYRSVGRGKQFSLWYYLSDETAGKRQPDGSESLPTRAMKGRLRLVRTGKTLFYYVSEAPRDDFILIDQHPFGADDVRFVRIGGTTGGPKAALDFRIIDLRIRAGSMPVVPAAARPAGKRWVVLALVISLVLTLSVGAWLGLRHSRRAAGTPSGGDEPAQPPEATPAIAFACSACGKHLKAGAGLAGRKLRCPGCGQAVLVTPGTSEAIQEGHNSQPLVRGQNQQSKTNDDHPNPSNS